MGVQFSCRGAEGRFWWLDDYSGGGFSWRLVESTDWIFVSVGVELQVSAAMVLCFWELYYVISGSSKEELGFLRYDGKGGTSVSLRADSLSQREGSS